MSEKIKIRPSEKKDFDEIWRIFQSVISRGDTYVNRAKTTKDEARAKWENKNAKVFVAEIDEKIVGVYLLKPNYVDRGSHVANASYIVDENFRGAGIGRALALHSISTAKEFGYKAMQFNFVVSTNVAAVNLWKSVGFKVVGIVPKVFSHKDLGYVDAFVMFREL